MGWGGEDKWERRGVGEEGKGGRGRERRGGAGEERRGGGGGERWGRRGEVGEEGRDFHFHHHMCDKKCATMDHEGPSMSVIRY